MSVQLCIFEDEYHSRLFPLTYFRPVYDLRCGAFSLREKIQRAYGGIPVSLHCREYLHDYQSLKNPGVPVNEITASRCLFVNGRVVAGGDFARVVPLDAGADKIYMSGDRVVAALVGGTKLQRLKDRGGGILSATDFEGIPARKVEATMVDYPWNLVNHNGAQLRVDCSALMKKTRSKNIRGKVSEGAFLLNKKDIYIGDGSEVLPAVVIDAEDGPVYIGKNVKILPQATIIGPVYIGDGSVIKVGAKIYEDTTIGPVCKIGGEVEASIIHGYSNKQHDGFLGHAYIGAWVNLGAGTTNSDLKNNYGLVKVFINGELTDSGSQFVGVTIGDHSKTAINSMFNTGTVIGVSSNIFGSGFPPKYVPSFSWGAAGETFTTYGLDRAIEVAGRVMARRKMRLTDADVALFKKIFELTSTERRERGMPE